MDIIVTSSKSRMKDAAAEAADCIAAGGGAYFRRFHARPPVEPGDRVYYVEDGYVRGFAVVDRVEHQPEGMRCETTGQFWQYGWYVFMGATTWKWIKPIPMKGFQNFRKADKHMTRREYIDDGHGHPADPRGIAEIVGGWLDPKPEA